MNGFVIFILLPKIKMNEKKLDGIDQHTGTIPTRPQTIEQQWLEILPVAIQWLTEEKRKKILEIIFWTEEWTSNDGITKKMELYYNIDAILKDIKEKYVEIIEDKEYLWLKWKVINLCLPPVWNFEWFNFNFFVSSENISENKPSAYYEWQDYPFCKKEDISKLLTAMKRYLYEYGIISDSNNLDYKSNTTNFISWYYLEKILGLNGSYWLWDIERWSLYTESFWEGDDIQLICNENWWYYNPIHFWPYNYCAHKKHPAGCILNYNDI